MENINRSGQQYVSLKSVTAKPISLCGYSIPKKWQESSIGRVLRKRDQFHVALLSSSDSLLFFNKMIFNVCDVKSICKSYEISKVEQF